MTRLLNIVRPRWSFLSLTALIALASVAVVLTLGGSAASAPAAPTTTSVSAELKSRLLANGIRLDNIGAEGNALLRLSGARQRADKAVRVTQALPGAFGKNPSVALVSFTDNQAKHISHGAATRKFVGRLAWMVIYHEITFPIFGQQDSGAPQSYVADMAAFVDASTGKFLVALTL